MRKVLAVLLVPIAALFVAMPASAGSPSGHSYHGTFSSTEVCAPTAPIEGTWNVTLRNDGTAVVDVTVFEYDATAGKYVLHAVWGGYAFRSWFTVDTSSADGFSVTHEWGLNFTLANGNLTYTIPGYCENGDAAVLHGTLTT